MSTPQITRELVSTTSNESWKLTYDGWLLNFTVARSGDAVKTISVFGNKGDVSLNAALSETGHISFGFNKTNPSIEITTVLITELVAFKNSTPGSIVPTTPQEPQP